MKTKAIGWAYPTSPIADKLKCPNGTWFLEYGNEYQAFDTRSKALKEALKLEVPWSVTDCKRGVDFISPSIQ